MHFLSHCYARTLFNLTTHKIDAHMHESDRPGTAGAAGLFARIIAALVHEGLKKEHGWFLSVKF